MVFLFFDALQLHRIIPPPSATNNETQCYVPGVEVSQQHRYEPTMRPTHVHLASTQTTCLLYTCLTADSGSVTNNEFLYKNTQDASASPNKHNVRCVPAFCIHVRPRPPWANGERIGGKPSNIKTGLIGNRGPSVCFNISAEFLACNHRRVHNLPAATTNHGLRYELITAVACTHATTEKVRDKTSYQQAQLSGGDIWWTTSKRTQHEQPLTKYTPRNQEACSMVTGPCDATTLSGSKDRQPFPIQRYSKRQPTFSSLPRRSPGTPDLCQLSSQHPHHPSKSVTTTWR